jgi:hypothetical protein
MYISEAPREDYRIPIKKEPEDVLAVWAVVCCLALGVIVGLSHSLASHFSPESLWQAGASLAPPTHSSSERKPR